MRRLKHFVLAASALLLTGCIEWAFFYNPDRQHYAMPDDRGLRYEAVRFDSADGTPLQGWFIGAQGAARGTVIHFHGNTKNISGHLRYVDWLPQRGYNIFLFDYRGYGESGGSPAPRGIHEDGKAAIAYVRTRADVDPGKLLIFGQSLGGNYALTALAASPLDGIRAVVIEAAFASHRAIALEKIAHYALPLAVHRLFVALFIGDGYDAEDAVQRIAGIPLLIIHGTADDVVAYRHSEILYARAAPPKTLWTVPNGGHLHTFVYLANPYHDMLVNFFDAALDGSALTLANPLQRTASANREAQIVSTPRQRMTDK